MNEATTTSTRAVVMTLKTHLEATMTQSNSVWNSILLGWLISVCTLFATPSFAATIWADWTTRTVGSNGGGSAIGNAGAVTYSGELDGATISGAANIWNPDSTFVGGTITTSPNSAGDILVLNGDYTGVNTITWASPVTNPVFAFWSLGHLSSTAAFIFDATPTFQVGGPIPGGFGGHAITVSGNTVSGNEGNGVVEFTGTFSSISWTSVAEGGGRDGNYGFTVGANGPRATGVPEPVSVALLGLGLAVLGLCRRKKASPL